MSESGWRSRLLQTVGKGLLRLGTYFVRQAETPPAASASPPDAPPWLPPEFWQQRQGYAAGNPSAHWLALLAESQIPLQWVGTSGPPPSRVIPAAAAGIEETTDDAGSVTLPPPPIWAAPDYAPAAPAPAQAPPGYIPPQRQRSPGSTPQGGESPGSKRPPVVARLIPTPETNPPPSPAVPAYLPDAPAVVPPDVMYAPLPAASAAPPAYQGTTPRPFTQEAATAALPAPPPAAAVVYTPASVAPPAAPVYAAAPPPLPELATDAPPRAAAAAPPAPDYGMNSSLSPSVSDDYRPSLPPRLVPPVYAPPAAGIQPSVAYPPHLISPLQPAAAAQTLPAGPLRRQPQSTPRYAEQRQTPLPDAAPRYAAAPAPGPAAPLPEPLPAADRWPALPPLFADEAPPAAQPEPQRQQRLEREQRGEREYA